MFCLKYLLFALCLLKTCYGDDPVIISRKDWNARAAKKTEDLKHIPPEYAVIHHSAGPTCNTMDKCKMVVKGIQDFHMDNQKWYDIGYNFLVGGDGNVYEGRGWNKHGSHLPALNSNSLGICLLGSFQTSEPTEEQLKATQDLIAYGVKNNYLSSNYKLIGHRQKISTQCPGNNVYGQIVNWPHWTNDIE